jgi:hypothetical protein
VRGLLGRLQRLRDVVPGVLRRPGRAHGFLLPLPGVVLKPGAPVEGEEGPVFVGFTALPQRGAERLDRVLHFVDQPAKRVLEGLVEKGLADDRARRGCSGLKSDSILRAAEKWIVRAG